MRFRIFALELTYDVQALLPLLIASMIAHAFTVLVMRRSILTEKVARRGHHLTREYSVEPDVMSREVVTVRSMRVKELRQEYFNERIAWKHHGYPVLGEDGDLVGIVTRSHLLQPEVLEASDVLIAADILEREPLTAYEEETCRSVAEKMAHSRVGGCPSCRGTTRGNWSAS